MNQHMSSLYATPLRKMEEGYVEIAKRWGKNMQNVEELERALYLCWQDIDSRITVNLVCSMPRRYSAVYDFLSCIGLSHTRAHAHSHTHTHTHNLGIVHMCSIFT